MIPKVFVGDCDVGRGVFASSHFLPGDLILTLRGQRVDRDDPVHATPLAANLLQTGRKTYIWPIQPGVFVNHSCNPNAGIVDNRRLVAIREILPGTEIRFDYSTTMDEDDWTMECHCGDPLCRSRVVDFCHLPADLRERYLALHVVPGFIARRYSSAPRRTNATADVG